MPTLLTSLDSPELLGKPTTELTNFDFNSYALFGDKHLCCTSTGLYEITGFALDSGYIDAAIETFETDLDHNGANLIRYYFLGIQADGDLQIIPIIDGVDQTPIEVTSKSRTRQLVRISGDHPHEGDYWKFRIVNVDGAWFTLDLFQVLPINITRGRRNG